MEGWWGLGCTWGWAGTEARVGWERDRDGATPSHPVSLKGSCPRLHLGSGFLSRGSSGGLFCILVQGGETFSPHFGVFVLPCVSLFRSAFAHWPHAVTLYWARCMSLRAGSHPDPVILQSCHRFAES